MVTACRNAFGVSPAQRLKTCWKCEAERPTCSPVALDHTPSRAQNGKLHSLDIDLDNGRAPTVSETCVHIVQSECDRRCASGVSHEIRRARVSLRSVWRVPTALSASEAMQRRNPADQIAAPKVLPKQGKVVGIRFDPDDPPIISHGLCEGYREHADMGADIVDQVACVDEMTQHRNLVARVRPTFCDLAGHNVVLELRQWTVKTVYDDNRQLRVDRFTHGGECSPE